MLPTLNFFRMGMSAPDVALRFMGIYQAQFRGLEAAGARVHFTLDRPDPAADFTVCSANSADLARAAAETNKPLIVYAPPADQWFDRPLLEQLRGRILFVYGPFTSQSTADHYRQLGLDFHTLPFAADPDLMRPLHLPSQYDVVFLGGLHHRQNYQPFIEPLLAKIPIDRLLFIGTGWKKYGIPPQSVAYGPLVNILYNLGRVCINFHAPEQMRGPADQLDVNNRLFDLAMAGCVQVCDNPQAVASFFTPAEIFAEATPGAWVARVLDCLALPDSQLAPRRHAARAKALAQHTWTHRGRTLLGWIARHTAQARLNQ